MSEIHDFFLILSFRQPTTNVMQHASKRLKTAAELPLLPTVLAVLLAVVLLASRENADHPPSIA